MPYFAFDAWTGPDNSCLPMSLGAADAKLPECKKLRVDTMTSVSLSEGFLVEILVLALMFLSDKPQLSCIILSLTLLPISGRLCYLFYLLLCFEVFNSAFMALGKVL